MNRRPSMSREEYNRGWKVWDSWASEHMALVAGRRYDLFYAATSEGAWRLSEEELRKWLDKKLLMLALEG